MHSSWGRTGDAVFLFEDDVKKFLGELRDFGIKHRQSRIQLKGITEPEGETKFRETLRGELEAYAEAAHVVPKAYRSVQTISEIGQRLSFIFPSSGHR
jgi:hypothetical protein